jgi:beta-N-acetylhexosaminidase
MRVIQTIFAVILSLVAVCLLAFTGIILLDPVVGTDQPPVVLDTNQIFVPQEPEATPPPVTEPQPDPVLPPAEQPPEEKPPVDQPQQEDFAVTLARAYAAGMTLEDKIWQLFFTTPESLTGVSPVTLAGETTKKSIEARPVGGLVYFSANLQDRSQVQKLLSGAQSFAKTPMFLGVDEEGGIVSRVGGNSALGTTKHPSAADVGKTADMKTAFEVGKTMANELMELGFNLNFAPVADVITNPDNTEIGSRAYSADPETAAAMVAAMVQGLQHNGMISCLKHFPGHGSTAADSHLGASVSNRTPEQLRETEWLPFAAGLEQDAAFVMLSHLTNPYLSTRPASMSLEVVAYLRQELNFDGVIITDSQQMGAITDHYPAGEAAVLSLWAGADMILMPQDLQAAFDGVRQAVADGTLTEERITESVIRILTVKYRFGIMDVG